MAGEACLPARVPGEGCILAGSKDKVTRGECLSTLVGGGKTVMG